MPYFYNTTPQEIAGFGASLGNSLGQAFVGLPQQRAEMALRLAELQRQNQMMQQQGQYRNQMLGLREQDLQRKTDYDNLMGQFHLGQNQNQALAEQVRMVLAQVAQQRAMQPRVEGGQVITPQAVPQGLPVGQQGPTLEQAGRAPATGLQYSVTPLAPKNQYPPTLLPTIAALNRDYMGGIGSTNQALSNFAQTNTLPLLMRLQQQAMGQPTQQALTNGVPQPATSLQQPVRWSWDPTNGLQQQ